MADVYGNLVRTGYGRPVQSVAAGTFQGVIQAAEDDVSHALHFLHTELFYAEKKNQRTVQPYAFPTSGTYQLHQSFAVHRQSAGYAALPAISAGRSRKSAAPFSLGCADAHPVP